MEKGFYRCTHDNHMHDNGSIVVEVSETEKSYILKLIENTYKYSPAHIDMLFEKSNKVVIKKEKSPHAIIEGGDYFVIYPYRAGLPYLFEQVVNDTG